MAELSVVHNTLKANLANDLIYIACNNKSVFQALWETKTVRKSIESKRCCASGMAEFAGAVVSMRAVRKSMWVCIIIQCAHWLRSLLAWALSSWQRSKWITLYSWSFYKWSEMYCTVLHHLTFGKYVTSVEILGFSANHVYIVSHCPPLLVITTFPVIRVIKQPLFSGQG